MIVFATHIETQGIEGNLKLWAHSDQSAGDRFEYTVPFKLNCKQLSLGVRLQDDTSNKISIMIDPMNNRNALLS